MKKIAYVIIISLFCLAASHQAKADLFSITIDNVLDMGKEKNEFSLEDLTYNEFHKPIQVYHFIIPSLINAKIINEHGYPQSKVAEAVKYVNFFSYPGLFTPIQESSSAHYIYRMGNWIRTGNAGGDVLSGLAAMILRPYFPQNAIREGCDYALFEVKHDGKWFLIDPYFDLRLRDANGDLPTFEYIRELKEGKSDSLVVPGKTITPRLEDFFSLFDESCFTGQQHGYGDHKVFPGDSYSSFVGWSMEQFLKELKREGRSLDDGVSNAYLGYIRNNVWNQIMRSEDRASAIQEVQDHFLSKLFLRRNQMPYVDQLYFARSYQLLGRYDEALHIYNKLVNNKQALLFKSQILFDRKEKNRFNELSSQLGDIVFYRYMFWQLNEEYLREQDKELFPAFIHRDYLLDKEAKDTFHLQ